MDPSLFITASHWAMMGLLSIHQEEVGSEMNITTIGIDLAKNVFQIYGVDAKGKAVMSKRLSRKRLVPFFADLPPCLIGMEACGSSHYWVRWGMRYARSVHNTSSHT